jgi:hypothetical protein
MQVRNIKKHGAQLAGAGMTVAILANQAFASSIDALNQGVDASKPTGAQTDLFGGSGIFTVISNTLIFLVGAISVIMLIIGGFRYVISSGNSSAVEGAKNTILYAIIGIVVAAAAYAVVYFVVGKF